MSSHSSERDVVEPAAAPGWAMGPLNGAAAGLDARGSWLLEPETGTGMLLYPRDCSFVERRDVATYLREQGWTVVPTSRFLHISSDGDTVIRLLSSSDPGANRTSSDDQGGQVVTMVFDRDDADQLEASL